MSDPKFAFLRNCLLIVASLLLVNISKKENLNYRKPIQVFISIFFTILTINVILIGFEPANTELLEINEIDHSLIGTSVFFVDARTQNMFNYEHVQGALSIPYYKTKYPYKEIEKKINKSNFIDLTIITYCDSQGCDLAQKLATKISKESKTKIYVLNGGIEKWKSLKLPITSYY